LNAIKRVLVTGAGGFIGRCSVAPLCAANCEVHAVLSKKTGPGERSPLADAQVHHVDLLDADEIEALIGSVRPTHLLHFAWIATPGLYWSSAENYRWLAASRYLLQCFSSHGGVRAVMAGSCAEYDWSRVGLCDERTSPLASSSGKPMQAYTECKIAMQQTLAEVGRTQGLSTAWGRIFFQFGPHEHPERLVATVILNLLSGREALCTHGRQVRSYLHVADVGAAFAALLHSEVTGPVNVGSGERISIAALLEELARQIGHADLLKLGARAAPPGEPAVLVPDIGRLRHEVGFKPRWRLDEGLADAIGWWRGEIAGGRTARPS
jgi:nucleoside-diphosphate-sugar epimerase